MNDLVLLHGIGTGPEAWAPQVDAFSATRRVLTPPVPLDLGRAVEELQAVDAARLDLCGLSWGALVALRFALEDPARVRRLAVCAGFASLPRALRALQYALSLAGRELARPMREGARFDVRTQIASLEPPLLVLCGERDRVNRPLSRALAIRAPQANFELIPDAGHVANVDNPAAFTAALERFFGYDGPQRTTNSRITATAQLGWTPGSSVSMSMSPRFPIMPHQRGGRPGRRPPRRA